MLQLLRMLGKRNSPQIRKDCNSEIWQQLERLGTFTILDNMAKSTQYDLLLKEEHVKSHPITQHERTSFPVYRLSFSNCDNRRRPVHEFKTWISHQLKKLNDLYIFEPNGLIILLGEIAKNTADHANSEALFGLDAVPMDKNHSRISFVFGDLGIGIKQHIERNLPPEDEKRREKMSLYEAYRLALKPGYTSNRSSTLNKGHGMSIIVDCVIDLGIHLSIFDAKSRGLLSGLEGLGNPSHAAIRRIFHNVGHDVGFFYYGEFVVIRK